MRLIVDTNVWLRIADKRSSQHQIAKESVSSLLRSNASIYLVPQNLVEFWAVATRPVHVNGLGWDTQRAALELQNLTSTFELLPENEYIFPKWLESVSVLEVSGKEVHDARLASQLAVHNIEFLLTFNHKDFTRYSWCASCTRTILPHKLN